MDNISLSSFFFQNFICNAIKILSNHNRSKFRFLKDDSIFFFLHTWKNFAISGPRSTKIWNQDIKIVNHPKS